MLFIAIVLVPEEAFHRSLPNLLLFPVKVQTYRRITNIKFTNALTIIGAEMFSSDPLARIRNMGTQASNFLDESNNQQPIRQLWNQTTDTTGAGNQPNWSDYFRGPTSNW